MYKLGKSTLLHDAPDAAKYRFGFHRPPFNSVDHLHLHCTALPYKSVWRRLKYVSVGWLGAYVSVEHVLQYLDTNKDTKTGVPLGDEPELHVWSVTFGDFPRIRSQTINPWVLALIHHNGIESIFYWSYSRRQSALEVASSISNGVSHLFKLIILFCLFLTLFWNSTVLQYNMFIVMMGEGYVVLSNYIRWDTEIP